MSYEKFVLSRDVSNEFTFTIKQSTQMVPMVLVTGDTFVVRLYNLESDSIVSTIGMVEDSNGVVTLDDMPNGKIKVVFSSVLVDSLEVSRGDRADDYYLKALYRIVIEAETTNNGKFPIVLDKVYVR